jgi:hypothetical protein
MQLLKETLKKNYIKFPHLESLTNAAFYNFLFN